MLPIPRTRIRPVATVGLALVLLGCAERIQPEAPGASGGSSAPIGGRGGNGASAPVSDAGASGGAAATSARIYLGDEDRPGAGPDLPVPVTASFFWRQPSDGTDAFWRLGNWFLTTDRPQDAHSRQLEQPREGSIWARGVRAEGRLGGVVLWVQLDHPQNRAVSVQACSAVSFWVRLDSASGMVRVALNDGSAPSGLLTNGSALPAQDLALGAEWQQITIPFDSPPFHSSALASIEFFVGQDGQPFDLLIDDLALICRMSPS